LPDQNPAVLVSGGIDSSIIACLVKKYYSDSVLYSLADEQGADYPYLRYLSCFLNKPITLISTINLKSIVNQTVRLIDSRQLKKDLTQISLASAIYLILKRVAQNRHRFVFSGQGPDILLAGYHRYQNITNLKNSIKNDLPDLEIDRQREQAVADSFGLKIIYPYLEKTFIKFCLSLPENQLIHQGFNKYILREYGRFLELPEVIVNRPKKALQYSTGIQKLVQKIL
jgi:asparagine synthase (glutamine-hydrolysing)